MRRLAFALTLAVLAAGQASALAQTPASARADVLAPIHQFVDGFNKGDTKTALAACADQTSIIDEFPPYEWHGAGACARWAGDYDADAKKNGITDGIVTLGTPAHVDVTADRAYVVIPSDYAFKQNGKPIKEVGSTFTFALQKGAAGWRIIGWAWSKH
jgi:hypothetical protein